MSAKRCCNLEFQCETFAVSAGPLKLRGNRISNRCNTPQKNEHAAFRVAKTNNQHSAPRAQHGIGVLFGVSYRGSWGLRLCQKESHSDPSDNTANRDRVTGIIGFRLTASALAGLARLYSAAYFKGLNVNLKLFHFCAGGGIFEGHRLETSFGNILFRRYLQNTIDYLMLAAQGYQESMLDQSQRSSRGAVRIMQVIPSYAAAPPINIPSCTLQLSQRTRP